MKSKQSMIQRQAGFSMVELLVGIAVGLFIVAGAAKFFTDFIISNKRLVVETRVNQDLRAAADIVARDLRRAGYWNNATAGVWGIGSASVTANPNATGAGATSSTTSSVSYSYARNAGDVAKLDTLDSNEYSGFVLGTSNGIGVLRYWDGGGPSSCDIAINPGLLNCPPITDPGTVNVTAFTITAASPALVNDLSTYCGCLGRQTCTNTGAAGARDIANLTFNPAGPPMLTIPSFQIVLTGQAVNDPAITRTVNETVRVRNASLTGTCPA